MDAIISRGSSRSVGGYAALCVGVSASLMLFAACDHPLQMCLGYLLVTMGQLVGAIGAMT